jgi:peptidyl-tRNA hydrolase
VLSDFTPQEEAIVKPVIASVSEAIDCFLSQGIDAAMSKFNQSLHEATSHDV